MNFALRRGMPAVELHVAAPPASVWNVLVDLDAWPQWGPSVQRAEVAGIGATRHEVHAEDDGSRIAFGVPWWAPAYLPICAIAVQRIARMAR